MRNGGQYLCLAVQVIDGTRIVPNCGTGAHALARLPCPPYTR